MAGWSTKGTLQYQGGSLLVTKYTEVHTAEPICNLSSGLYEQSFISLLHRTDWYSQNVQVAHLIIKRFLTVRYNIFGELTYPHTYISCTFQEAGPYLFSRNLPTRFQSSSFEVPHCPAKCWPVSINHCKSLHLTHLSSSVTSSTLYNILPLGRFPFTSVL